MGTSPRNAPRGAWEGRGWLRGSSRLGTEHGGAKIGALGSLPPTSSSPSLLLWSLCPPQVVEETHLILKEYGFRFVRRGAIYVKGKGELLTFFLKGREKQGSFVNGSSVTLPHQVVDSS